MSGDAFNPGWCWWGWARRGFGRWLLVVMLAASLARSQVTVTDEHFAPLRPPVLGHAVQWDATRDVYRLVTDAEPPVVLVSGSLEMCQALLIDRLQARWGSGRLNLSFKTLGAMQFWGDVFLCAGWRIQENVLTGSCRLLDEHDVRRAWGKREACRAAFERLRAEEGLAPRSDELVLLLHGLGRGRRSLARMATALEAAGFEARTVAYPSTRRSLAEHADQLVDLLDGLEGTRRVSFVTHSLGGLVVRAALAREVAWAPGVELGRVVMLAPPSSGSALAAELESFLPVSAVLGPALIELAQREAAALPAPSCEFGIVAAGRGNERGLNPLLEGDDDGVVSVDETRLPGAADFLVVKGWHSFLMNDPEVIEATVRFLQTGSFADS